MRRFYYCEETWVSIEKYFIKKAFKSTVVNRHCLLCIEAYLKLRLQYLLVLKNEKACLLMPEFDS